MRLWHKIKSKFDTPQKREQWGWAMYDWANAAYVTSAAGVFAGPYVTSLAKEEACIKYSDGLCSWCDLASACINSINATICAADMCSENSKWCCDKSGHVPIGSTEIGYGSFYPFTMAAAVIVEIFLLPILGAMADYANNQKKLFMICTYTSATFLILMFFVHGPSVWWLGGLLLFFTTIFFGASSVFYDSFLNLIADVEDRTWLSSAGYGIGYAGGGLFLGLNMLIYNLNDSRLTIRFIISGAGVWWVLWSIITFVNLREHKEKDEEQISLIGDGTGKSKEKKSRNACVLGCLQLIESLRVVKHLPYTIIFLISAAFFNDGIQTVLSMTSVFGQEALGLDSSQLGMAVLMVQFVAFFGAFGFGFVARKLGDKNSTLITLVVWIACVTVMYFVEKFWEFMIVAFVVGLVLGGSQALSRGMFAKMVPKGYESQLFSFYQLSQRGTSWMGPLAYGLLTTRYDNNPRPGVLVLAVFLIIGAVLLWFVNMEKAREQALHYSKNKKEQQFEERSYKAYA